MRHCKCTCAQEKHQIKGSKYVPNEMLNKYINSYIVAQSQKKMEDFHEQTENFNLWVLIHISK